MLGFLKAATNSLYVLQNVGSGIADGVESLRCEAEVAESVETLQSRLRLASTSPTESVGALGCS